MQMKSYIKKYLLLVGCILFLASFSFPQPAQSIGKITSYRKTANGISGRTSTAIFDVQVYSPNIIRVRVSGNKVFDDFSYALVSNDKPGFNNFSVSDRGNTIAIVTANMLVEIEKQPSFRVLFKNKQGDIINEDVKGNGFGTSFIGKRWSLYKVMQTGERFVGLGEVLGDLDKKGNGFTLNNTDTYKYGDPRLSMYGSIPFYIGIHNNKSYGLFYNNTYKLFFNFGLSTPGFTSVTSDGGDVDYFLMYDTTVAKVISHYTSLTGRMPLPPLWSLGYHQSRCSYYPQQTVQWIAETFRRKKIPIDCIVLDADYLQDYEPFRINKQRFPDMPGLSKKLQEMGIELTASVNPGIKIDSTYNGHVDGLKKDVFIKYSNGDLFVSDIAPSTNHFVDFTNPKARNWWMDHMKFLAENGIAGYWNDMNEPAVGGSYLPDNLVFDFDGHKANALKAKNVYGMQMARSSFESALKYGNGRRPFVLTRSSFAGVQRYSAVWSGDNMAKDEYLLSGVLLNNQMGLSGISFVGPDLGGYIGDASKDLFKRWIEVGVFSPFVRTHREFFGAASDPWSYGEETEAIVKNYIELRYRFMPYTYGAFYEASQTGMPIARSLCINYPNDEKVYDHIYQYQFLFGKDLLVIPVTSQELYKKMYLPKGNWYNIHNDELLKGPQELVRQVPIYQIPLFAKASAIIPMQSIVQSTKELPADTLYIHVFNGYEKNAFTYYEDDGISMQYQQEQFCKKEFVLDPLQKQFIIQSQQGKYPSHYHYLQIVFHDFQGIDKIKVNNEGRETINGDIKIVDGLKGLEDIYDKITFKSLRENETKATQRIITIPNSVNQITLQW